MLPTDIDKLTDEEVEALLETTELKCKVDPKTQKLICATPEDINRAIARLKKPIKQLVFEVTTEPEPAPDPRLNPTES